MALPKVSTPPAIPGLRNPQVKLSKEQEEYVKVFELLLGMRLFLKVHENMYSYRDVWTDCIHETDDKTGDSNRPFIVVMALILSAKESDYSVMQSIVELNSAGLCHPRTMARAKSKEVAPLLKMGIQNEKSKYLVDTAKVIVDEHNGQVPCNYRKLRDFPGVGDKAGALGHLQQPHRLFLIPAFGDLQNDRLVEVRKLRDLFYLVQDGVDLALQRQPFEPGTARNRAERQHEAVCESRGQESFRRLLVARPLKFGGRSGLERYQAGACQFDVVFGICGSCDAIMVRKFVHIRSRLNPGMV